MGRVVDNDIKQRQLRLNGRARGQGQGRWSMVKEVSVKGKEVSKKSKEVSEKGKDDSTTVRTVLRGLFYHVVDLV